MAALSEEQRVGVWAALMRGEAFTLQFPNPAGGLTKDQHRAVVDALDTALDSAAATFNSAIPQPQRGTLTSQQKAAYLVALIIKRYELG